MLIGSLRLRFVVDTNVLHQSTEYRSHANVNDLANVLALNVPCNVLSRAQIHPNLANPILVTVETHQSWLKPSHFCV